MAMFFKDEEKFTELENTYSNGVLLQVLNYKFTLTLLNRNNSLSSILKYKWSVALSDGLTFDVPMGEGNCSTGTRLKWIIQKFKDNNRDVDIHLANAINDSIDKIYRKYK